MSLRPVEFRGHVALEDTWDLVHRHALGRAGEAFVAALDEGRLLAARCPGCERVLLPPRIFCERCFIATELVDFAARNGELLTFTIVRHGFEGSPEVPYAIGCARLEGADSALGSLVEGFDPDAPDGALRVGMPVELRIAESGFGMERLRLAPTR